MPIGIYVGLFVRMMLAFIEVGAGRENRTPTSFRKPDFESPFFNK